MFFTPDGSHLMVHTPDGSPHLMFQKQPNHIFLSGFFGNNEGSQVEDLWVRVWRSLEVGGWRFMTVDQA